MSAERQIIAIAGGSGSGKTTFVKLLAARLGPARSVVLAQDRYYIDQSSVFRGDGENVNFDHPDALDWPLMTQHLIALKAGQSIDAPNYDFATHKRTQKTDRLFSKSVILVEGILIFQPEMLRQTFDRCIFIDTCESVRFERRLRRDTLERGRTEEGVRRQFLNQVKPMHDLYVEPGKSFAHQTVSGERDFMPAIDALALGRSES